MIYILMAVAYLAIGGILAGILDELDIDPFWWYICWPAVLLVIFVLVMEIPFERLGSKIRDGLRKLRNRKRK